jgi:hypothetical protein
VFEKSLRLRGLERFYKGMGTGHIHKGTGTVPLPDSRYGCGSRTLRFPHPDCRPALYQLRCQSSQLPPSVGSPRFARGTVRGAVRPPDARGTRKVVPPAGRGNLKEGVRNSPILEHPQPCPHKPLPFRRESMHCGRESTHFGRISHTLSVNRSGCHTGCLGRPVRHASPVR